MDATQEEWRPVVGREGCYEVSSKGDARSLDRITTRSDGVRRRLKGKPLKASPDDNGYLRVSISSDKPRLVRIHILVLEAFVEPRPEGLVGCHNDGDVTNNAVTNLRWDTCSANNFDIVKHGRSWQARKTHCKNGHEFTPENTYIRPKGGRKCRACALDGAAQQRERQAA